MKYLKSGTNPLVCVMMPVYNGARTIQLALASLVLQAYTNWICIIVNDGSLDGTALILDALSDPRFHIIHLAQNRGRGAARQIALEHAYGDYLTYLDADDFYHTKKLAQQVEILQQHPEIDLVGTAIVTYNTAYIPTSYRDHSHPVPVKHTIGQPLYLSMGTVMMRLPETAGISYNLKLNASEDVDFISRYLENRMYMGIPNAYYYYYVSEDTTTYSKMLAYTGNEMRRGLQLTDKSLKAGCKVTLKALIKWIIYALAIPLIGVNFFLKRRGSSISPEEFRIYNEQYQLVSSHSQ